MAIDENKVTWAPKVELDPRTGDPSRAPIDDEIREYGLKYNQPFYLQLFNQLMKDYGDQIKDLQQQINTITQGDTDNQALLQLLYQVGDIWVTQTEDNPATRFGFGTWEKIEGKFAVSSDPADTDFDVAGKTGGSKVHTHGETFSVQDHTLTLSEIPEISHSHDYVDRYHAESGTDSSMPFASNKESMPSNYNGSVGSDGTDRDNNTWLIYNDTTETVTFGGGQPHGHTLTGGIGNIETLPPYEVYNYWRRTA